MTIRARRRTQEGKRLEEMSDDELQEIRFFGCIMKNPHTTAFDATPEEQQRAVSILRERGTLSARWKR